MKPLIIANWKCHPGTPKEALANFNSVKNGVKGIKGADVVICPPFVFMPLLGKGVAIGAQDVFFKDSGAYTGEISPLMLKSVGCSYALVGHSERRRIWNESDAVVNKKVKAVIASGLKAVLCVENIQQLKSGLRGIQRKDLSRLMVAFEPVSAIGTGRPYHLGRAKKTRSEIERIVGRGVRILYGGSINSGNALKYIKEAGFEGLLVGGASLKPKEFVAVIRAVS